MASIDDILGQIRLPEAVYPLCTRADLRAEWEQAEQEIARAEVEARDSLAGASNAGKKAAQRVRDLEAEMAEHTVPIRVRALTHKALSDLIAAHPPREDKGERTFNVDTFGVALLAESAVDPVMNQEKAGLLVDSLTQGQWDDLWTTIWSLNQNSVSVPKSLRASELLRTSPKR
ncbi:hypothetical protein [Nonomuraea bangladeshensis]|uniref:hypothetical protein n=1 Tax=Nonomuraea bangladeshensis TaxID=404385 RepID=UPI003C30205A